MTTRHLAGLPLSLLSLASFGHDPAGVRELARRVLSGPPFRQHRPSTVEQLLERIGAFLGDLLARFFGAVSGDTVVAWTIVVIGAVLLLIAVWRWTRGLRVAPGVDIDIPQTPAWSASDHARAADEAIADGDLDHGLRLRYLAMVATLVERGVIRDVPGRTIRELDADVRTARPDLALVVADAGARLDRVLFAGAAATSEDLSHLSAALRAVGGPVTVAS